MTQTHTCKICRGPRPHNGSVCLGCGTELKNSTVTRVKTRKKQCPECCSYMPHILIDPGRWRCGKCNAVFEAGDVGYLDDRPDVNLEKQERYEQMKKQGKRR